MKTLLLLLTLSFLLNCYTYQSTVRDGTGTVYDSSATYQLLLNDNTEIIAKNLVEENDTYTYTGSDGTQKNIRTAAVKMIREKKFSTGKTIGLSLGIIAGSGALLLALAAAVLPPSVDYTD
ncbi:MAG: hypothetical protein ACXWB6_00055 [Kaistella sp.]